MDKHEAVIDELKEIRKELGGMHVQLAVYNEQLKMHIQRSTNLEALVESYKEQNQQANAELIAQFEPIMKHINGVKWLASVIMAAIPLLAVLFKYVN